MTKASTVLLLGGRPGILAGIARGLAAPITAPEVDPTSMRAVRDAVMRAKPSAAVLVEGLEDIDACEADPDRAFALNAEAAIHLAAACLEAKATPVLISTAEVFGNSGGPWSESDDAAPLSAYARTKHQGEQFLTRASKGALIVRTGPVLSEAYAEERARFSAPFQEAVDEMVSPISAFDLGRAIDALVSANAKGLFHVAPSPAESRADLWKRIAREAGEAEGNVVAEAGRRIQRSAPRARHAVLIGDKIGKLGTLGVEKEERTMGHRQEVRRVDKPWGHEIIWAHTERYVGKVLFVKAGERLSLQYHEKKDETVYVLSGKMVFEVGPKDGAREDLIMKAGDSYRITPLTTHRMIALEDTQILEASTPELDDVVRLEDKYGRTGTKAP